MGRIRALIVSACAITTHVTDRSVIPKSSAIADSATKTIDMLITCVTNATPIALNASHLWLPGGRESGAPESAVGSWVTRCRPLLAIL